MFHVERWQSDCFTWNKGGDLLKRLKLKILHYLTKIIWWFREKVVSLHRIKKHKLNN